MFFVMGISDGQKRFDFVQTIICNNCGGYGRYEVFMTYMVLSLFFIPVFKWSKQYFVKSTCCGTVYQLDPEVGKRIARGEDVQIQESDLQMCNRGFRKTFKRCKNCGFSTEENYDFCPKCGNPL